MICYLNVGYPIGYAKGHTPPGSDVIFEVERNGSIIGIGGNEIAVWLNASCGKEENEIIAPGGLSHEEFINAASRLKDMCALVEIDTADFKGLDNVIFMRQGMGIGYREPEGVYQISVGQNTYIGELAFEIWKMCGGARTFGEIKSALIKHGDVDEYSISEMCAALIGKGYIMASGIVKR